MVLAGPLRRVRTNPLLPGRANFIAIRLDFLPIRLYTAAWTSNASPEKRRRRCKAPSASPPSAATPRSSPLHLLLALLGQSEGLVFPVLEKLGTTPAALRRAVDNALGALPSAHGATQQPGSRAAAGRRARRGPGDRQDARRRLHVHRAPAARAGRRQGRRRQACCAKPGSRATPLLGALQGAARQPARDQPDAGGHVPGAGEVRAGPHRAGA